MIPVTPRTAIEMNQTAVRGPKIAPMPAVPCRWTAKTAEMMMTAIGTTHCSQRRGGDAQAFDRAQHRDRRRDDAVAVEECGAEQTGADQPAVGPRGPALSVRSHQREQRQDAALAPVVGAHDHGEILEGHHEVERPEDQREHAQHVVLGHRHAMGPGETFLQGVERAGADVAIHNPERAERQDRQPAPPGRLLRIGGHQFGARFSRRRSSSDTRKMATMITPEATHQRQMAWMTNSSRYVR